MQQRVRNHVRPLFGFAAPRGMCVDDAVFENDGPSVSRTQIVLLSNDVRTVVQRRKEGMSSDDRRAVVERARGRIDRVLFLTAASRHNGLSSPSARRDAEGRERLPRGTTTA